ncbi:DMT family transporter [Fertoebacter nigrum]|uniref:DMT family transporter n=1 Tax=Fertoeibacter niger TaxID=2656921 RepID=A0A8X8KMN3_9RHOB|nr:DMT family transporter [Fertoeibacter niger]NUB42906.1 DMT family transporter [Fertoeibacter niger]
MTAAFARPSTLSANLICMASMLIWAAGLPAADLLIVHIPPLPLTALRMALAAGVLLPLWLLADGRAVVAGAQWGRGILVGGIGFGVGSYLLIFAQSRTDAVTVAVISATMPVIGIALECLLDGRRLRAGLVAGLALSLAGGLLTYGGKLGAVGFGLGALAAFASVVCFTWGSRATVISFPALSPIGRTAITLTGGALATGIAAITQISLGGPAPDWAALGAREISALLLYGFGALALSQILWIISVGQLGIGLAALHINAAPFYVMLFLYALGGSWEWMQVLGAAIVGFGVIIAQGLMPRRARN